MHNFYNLQKTFRIINEKSTLTGKPHSLGKHTGSSPYWLAYFSCHARLLKRPATISDFVNQNLGRLLDMFYFDDPSLNHQDGLVGNPVSENKELKA
jgi:hypothetical protein